MTDWQIVPPAPDKCRICAVEHSPESPHDATSFYYRFAFANANKRSPTWADAMAHCEPEVQQMFTEHLNRIGIDVNSTELLGDIESQEELDARLNRVDAEGEG
jgi:hypothetical protein